MALCLIGFRAQLKVVWSWEIQNTDKLIINDEILYQHLKLQNITGSHRLVPHIVNFCHKET